MIMKVMFKNKLAQFNETYKFKLHSICKIVENDECFQFHCSDMERYCYWKKDKVLIHYFIDEDLKVREVVKIKNITSYSIRL